MENYTYSQKEETILFPEEPIVYAGFWERFVAVLIDAFILAIPNIILEYAFEVTGTILGLIMAWLYDALQESGVNQATIGKRAMNIKVVTTNRERISFGQATGRHFGKFISCIILFIGYFMMLWDTQRQTLHDKMASTLIIKS